MPNLSYSRTGFSYANNASLSDSYAVIAVTADTTNSPQSSSFPNSCNIQSVEIHMTSISAGSLSVTAYLSRIPNGQVIVTPATPSGATQDITYTSGTTVGGVAYVIDADYHYDSGLAAAVPGTIYVVAKLNTAGQTATADVRVNWRA